MILIIIILQRDNNSKIKYGQLFWDFFLLYFRLPGHELFDALYTILNKGGFSVEMCLWSQVISRIKSRWLYRSHIV